jgi:surface protein
MFKDCINFNQDISNWDVSSVTDMNNMFKGCINFNQDITKWKVHNVTDMRGMFSGCRDFNKNISNWDVSSVNDMRNMFKDCPISEAYKPKNEEEEEEDYEDAPEDVSSDQKCFWAIGLNDILIKDYLMNPNNFIIKLSGSSDNYECASLSDLKKSAKMKKQGHPYMYEGFYECSPHIMDKVRNTGVVVNFEHGDYIEEVEYIRLGTATAFYVVKPDWFWNGPVPEPRKFELVKIGNEEKYFVSKSIATKYDIDVVSKVHCDLQDKGYIYKLVPLNVGGKIVKKNKRKTYKKKPKKYINKSKNKFYRRKHKTKKYINKF